jgi:glycosyltransferase involved in cell wall biosynthesis
MSKMNHKTLYICPNGYLGGAERFICNITKGHIDNNNITSFEILFFSKGDAYELCQSIGATTHLLPISFRLKNPISLIRVLIWVRSLIKKNNFSVIHSTMPYAHIIAALSTIGMSIKRVWFQHGPVGGSLDKIANILPVNQIIFNSKFLETEHLRMPFANRRSHLHEFVNLGVKHLEVTDLQVQTIREKYLSKNEEILLLSAGRLCSWKGQDNIIRALKSLRGKFPQTYKKVKLLIVGDIGRQEDSDYKYSLIQLVNENNLDASVILTGHLNNISEYYKAADIFIHSSTIPEPFGLTVTEAMAAGTLVIGSNQGGITDILINNETGISYNATSTKAVTELTTALELSITKILQKDQRLKEITESARINIHLNYSIEKMTQQIETLLKRL